MLSPPKMFSTSSHILRYPPKSFSRIFFMMPCPYSCTNVCNASKPFFRWGLRIMILPSDIEVKPIAPSFDICSSAALSDIPEISDSSCADSANTTFSRMPNASIADSKTEYSPFSFLPSKTEMSSTSPFRRASSSACRFCAISILRLIASACASLAALSAASSSTFTSSRFSASG